LTLEEKTALTVGRDFWTTTPVERLGIPALWLSDGPTGVRKAPTSGDMGLGTSLPATCFPTESALAASWDVALVADIGRALGRESQALGVHVLLGPGVNLKRSPLCGRNFEYFSEDPVLSGELAAAFIAGVQEQGVGTSLKHFVANENETGRMYVDSLVDERTLRELYLRPFEIAIAKANPWTLMAAYNRLNGEFCAEHRHLLHEILKEEWGFSGIVMSDWLAVNDLPAGVDAGLHLQMPAAPTAADVVTAVEGGRLAEARLDTVVRELLAFILKADGVAAAARRPETTFDAGDHHALARRAAGESIVLLKNDGDLLPLRADAGQIALLGTFAKTPRYQGAGSSQVVPTRVTNTHDALTSSCAVTLESTRPPVLPLDRLTPLREWLAHPTGATLVGPVLEAMATSFGGGDAAPAPEAEEETMSMRDLLLDMPISKLTMMGALSQQDLTGLIAAANRPAEESTAGDGRTPT